MYRSQTALPALGTYKTQYRRVIDRTKNAATGLAAYLAELEQQNLLLIICPFLGPVKTLELSIVPVK